MAIIPTLLIGHRLEIMVNGESRLLSRFGLKVNP